MELCFQSHWLFDNLGWHATVKSSIKIYIVIHNIDPSQTCVLELYINQNFSSKRQKYVSISENKNNSWYNDP